MTVKVRQLMRVAAGKGPIPPPPPVPTMHFVQQPTDTPASELFDPVVTVQISDGGQDVLILTNNTGDCHINFLYATADATGLATFTGLSAGDNPSGPAGCTVRVSNITRPQIADIVSDVFHVTEPPPVIELIKSGVFETIDTTNVFAAIGETTGATLCIVAAASQYIPGNPVLVSNAGNVFQLALRISQGNWHPMMNLWMSTGPLQSVSTEGLIIVQSMGLIGAQYFYFKIPIGNIQTSWFSSGGYSPDPVAAPMLTTAEKAISFSAYTCLAQTYGQGPSGYTVSDVPWIQDLRNFIAAGYKILDVPGTEQPHWVPPWNTISRVGHITIEAQP